MDKFNKNITPSVMRSANDVMRNDLIKDVTNTIDKDIINIKSTVISDSLLSEYNCKIIFDMKDVLLMAPVESDRYKDNKENVSKVINAVQRGNTDKKYSAIVSQGAVKVEVLMVLTQEFIDSCYIYNPRAVVKY